MEVRKRQNVSVTGSGDLLDHSRSHSPESKGAKIDRSFTHCIILSFLMLICALIVPLFFASSLPEFMKKPAQQIFETFGIESKAHAVVIDAGSTGSRVLAFTFKRDLDHSLVLEDELWMQVVSTVFLSNTLKNYVKFILILFHFTETRVVFLC